MSMTTNISGIGMSFRLVWKDSASFFRGRSLNNYQAAWSHILEDSNGAVCAFFVEILINFINCCGNDRTVL